MLYYIYYNIYYNIYNIKLVAPYLPPKLIFQNVARSAVAHVARMYTKDSPLCVFFLQICIYKKIDVSL